MHHSTVLYAVQEGYAIVVSSWARVYFMVFYMIAAVSILGFHSTLKIK